MRSMLNGAMRKKMIGLRFIEIPNMRTILHLEVPYDNHANFNHDTGKHGHTPPRPAPASKFRLEIEASAKHNHAPQFTEAFSFM